MTRTQSATRLCGAVTVTLRGGQLPGGLRPTMHLFYRHRVIDVVDALPKFLDGWNRPMLDCAI